MLIPFFKPCLALASLSLAMSGCVPANAGAATLQPGALPVGSCINLGSELVSRRDDRNGGFAITEADFRRIADAGYETVRIPVKWEDKSDPKPPHRIDQAWLDHVQGFVDMAMKHDLKVIIDSHFFESFHNDPFGQRDWHAAVWSQIATRFADYPDDRLWFELENEPHGKIDNANLLEVFAPSYKAVRKVSPQRPIILGSFPWSGVGSLETRQLFDDRYVYPTIHYYTPFVFTHQRAHWLKRPEVQKKRAFPIGNDLRRLDQDAALIRAYTARTGKVPHIGETGAYEPTIAREQRNTYIRLVHEKLGPAVSGICMWAYVNNFRLYDNKREQWVPGILEAQGLTPRNGKAHD